MDKNATRFRAAIFDLDGTITDSPALHLATFNETLKEHNIVITRDQWFHVYEGTGARYIFEDVLTKHGLLGKLQVQDLLDQRRALFKDLAMQQLVPVKGFTRFFDQLQELQVPSIIATNAEPENVELSLQILKLTEERRVLADEVGKLKPDPAVYLLAAKKLGLPPEQCVVFEDSVPGVIAAKRAGCYCVCVLTTTTREALEGMGADLVVDDFTKISPGLLFSQV